jgi:putative membrane-bound dehydrogenase-like protein
MRAGVPVTEIEPRRLLLACAALLAARVLTARLFAATEDSDAELASQLPRILPTAPDEALKTFRVHPGYRLELVACEPDVADPVAIDFDEHGRMFVVEMRDYPFTSDEGNLTSNALAGSQPRGRVRLLEDRDEDGKVDASTVFLDGLHWPTAVACARGGAFVAAAPEILFARDDDGDGAADLVEVHYRGFGRHNVQALVNGLKWGLDHRLYGNSGGNGGEVRSVFSPDRPAVSLSGRDFRFAPGGPLEAIPSAGGQFGLSFDDFGNRFACSNSDHARHAVFSEDYLSFNPWLAATSTSVSIAADGAAAPVHRASAPEPWRLVRTRWRAASAERSRFAPTELVPVGFFTSATGLLVYGGDACPQLRGNLFVGDAGGNLVHRKVLEEHGPTFRARRPAPGETSEFIASSDNWFRPVQLADGPDGALYVLDMYRETIEHPYSIPERIRAHLDLQSGNDRGRIYRVVPERAGGAFEPRRARPRLAGLTAADLAREVASANAWTRRTAARLLVERFAAAPDAAVELRRLLRQRQPAPGRLHALHTLAAISRLETEDLGTALADPHPALRRHAVRLAEARLEGDEALLARVVELAADGAPAVRFQVAVSLGQSSSPLAVEALATIARRDAADPWIRSALLSASARHGLVLLERLVDDSADEGGRRFAEEPGAIALLSRLLEVEGARSGAVGLARVLGAIARIVRDAPAARVEILRALGDGLGRRGETLAALLVSPPAELAEAATALRAVLEHAAREAADRTQTAGTRRAAAALLAHAPVETALPVLTSLLEPGEPPDIQVAAVQALGGVENERTASALLDAWPGLSPALRREAAEALFRRPPRLHALLDALASGRVQPADLDPARRKQLLDHPESSVRVRARAVLGEVRDEDRARVVERHRAALDLRGDRARGAEVFRKACATCHRAAGEGHAVGPDIETVRDRDAESLLVQLLDPDREVAPAYVAYTAVTAGGRAITGRIAEETATSVRFLRAEGAEDTVLRAQLVRLESTGRSLMPADLEKTVDEQGLADLIEFIRSLGK